MLSNQNHVQIQQIAEECGYDSLQWLGKCPGCGSWNTMVEEIVPEETQGAGKGGVRLGLSDAQKPQPIAEVETRDLPRFTTGSPELDRVLGGGVIPGSMVLIVGDPGVGKSSLTLEACAPVARPGETGGCVAGAERPRPGRRARGRGKPCSM